MPNSFQTNQVAALIYLSQKQFYMYTHFKALLLAYDYLDELEYFSKLGYLQTALPRNKSSARFDLNSVKNNCVLVKFNKCFDKCYGYVSHWEASYSSLYNKLVTIFTVIIVFNLQ